MNKIILIGNLTADPEMRTTPNGVSVCTMNIAVNRRFADANGERKTDFFRITAWRQLGENCGRFLSKGKKMCVIGELTARTYEGKDGATRVSLEVTADEVEFLSPREQAQATPDALDESAQWAPPPPRFVRPQSAQAKAQGYQRQYGKPQEQSTKWASADEGFTEINDDDFPF